ncbi:MAG: transglutaminase family protein [Planctomycetaceae bacterium]|nr:transglutaminase family protein [Planctomycetaceae bacterium]
MNAQRFLPIMYLVLLTVMFPACSRWQTPKLAVVTVTDHLDTDDSEICELISIAGKPSGYQRTTIKKTATDSGEEAYQVSQETVVIANRLSEKTSGRFEITVLQRRDGTFLRGQTTLQFGKNPMMTLFTPDESQTKLDRLASTVVIDTQTGEETPPSHIANRSIVWQKGTAGHFALYFSLWNKPLQPEEKRGVSYFDLLLEQNVSVELSAGQVSPFLLNGSEIHLLPVKAVTNYSTQSGTNSLTWQFWMDAKGNVVRTVLQEPQEIEWTLSTESKINNALKNAGNLNLNLYAIVPVQGTIPQPRETKRVTFLLQYVGADNKQSAQPGFAEKIPKTAFQTVKTENGTAWTVTVTGSSPQILSDLYGNVIPPAKTETSTPGDLSRNEWIQSDDAAVTELANVATEKKFPLWDAAVDLEKFVHEKMRHVSYESSLKSAGEAAKTLTGDSAAHAVLLAAIARRKNIPSQIAVGLVYTTTASGEGVLVLHFWTELFIDGHWHPFDATLGHGGADASRIVLTRSNLADQSMFSLIAPLLPLVKHLQAIVVKAE